MPTFDLSLSVLNALLSAIVLAGLVQKGRVSACTALPIYLLLGILFRIGRWTFYATWRYDDVWRYDIPTDLVQVLAGAAVAVELIGRAFVALPGGRVRARRLQLLVVAVAVVWLLRPWPEVQDQPWTYVYGLEAVRRLAYVRTWLFASTLAVASFYGVPLDRVHRDIAAGFVLWSGVMGLGAYLCALDGALQLCRQVVASLIYPGILAAWALMAWAPDERSDLTPALLVRLRPWRA